MAHISKIPIDKLNAIREIYTDNMNLLHVNHFKYDSNNSDSDILQNVVNISMTHEPIQHDRMHKITYPLVSDALQLSYRI